MDFMKENAVIGGNISGLKANAIPPSASKRQQNALLDVRNTVHKKRLGEPSVVKQFLEVRDARGELGTPRRKLLPSPTGKRLEAQTVEHLEDLDDCKYLCCSCNFDGGMSEDDYLPERCQFTEADLDNLARIWYGRPSRDVDEDFVISPLKIEKYNINRDEIIMKPDLFKVSLNDSGIDLDIEIEME